MFALKDTKNDKIDGYTLSNTKEGVMNKIINYSPRSCPWITTVNQRFESGEYTIVSVEIKEVKED